MEFDFLWPWVKFCWNLAKITCLRTGCSCFHTVTTAEEIWERLYSLQGFTTDFLAFCRESWPMLFLRQVFNDSLENYIKLNESVSMAMCQTLCFVLPGNWLFPHHLAQVSTSWQSPWQSLSLQLQKHFPGEQVIRNPASLGFKVTDTTEQLEQGLAPRAALHQPEPFLPAPWSLLPRHPEPLTSKTVWLFFIIFRDMGPQIHCTTWSGMSKR